MNPIARITCKTCGCRIGCTIDKERVGQMLKDVCPQCNTPFSIKISTELIQQLENLQVQRQRIAAGINVDDTFVPRTDTVPKQKDLYSRNSVRKDETFVPLKNDSSLQQTQVLVLSSLPSAQTPYQRLIISQPYTVVGRKNQSGVVYQPDVEVLTLDKFMSKKHCLIKKQDNGMFSVEDYKSANGTKLNGRKLEPGEAVYLMSGDTLTLGHSDFNVSFDKE